MESNEIKKLVKELYSNIQYHDFYYEYADDSRAYHNGDAEQRVIIKLIRTILTESPESEESLLRNCLKVKTDSKLQNQIKSFFKMAKQK